MTILPLRVLALVAVLISRVVQLFDHSIDDEGDLILEGTSTSSSLEK
jgi:hypothetical protein